MNRYRVDLHIHSLLSPCGDLEMSPAMIVERAVEQQLDAIAICDHNTTLQTPVIESLARKRGVVVFYGIELTTKEEAHCLAILPDRESAAKLQRWIDDGFIKVANHPEKFGDQIWVDEDENIAGEVDWYLNSSIDHSVEDIAEKVVSLGGLFIPAHVERMSYSLIGQLGFIDPSIPVNAVEFNHLDLFEKLKTKHKYLGGYCAYTASDAHFPHLIGTNPSWLYAEELTFDELRKAFAAEGGRKIISCQEER